MKHIPERSCISCKCKKPKFELVRIVRTPQGSIELDPTGGISGRGAYICRKQECWETVFRKKKLESSLKVNILSEQRSALINYSKSLPTVVEER